ncbi:MAG: hypothetical protein ACI9LN_000955 [Saprospiraceae bacterium]|jgi:hypothetical protein
MVQLIKSFLLKLKVNFNILQEFTKNPLKLIAFFWTYFVNTLHSPRYKIKIRQV